jgi:hypothetical protein
MTLLTRYRILRALKIVAFLVSILYIVWHISRKPELHDPDLLLKPFGDAGNAGMLAVVLFLMLVNWSIEAIKWRSLLASVENVGFFHSLRAVLSGVTVSFYTPNRVGEFAGRILHLEPEHRVRGALATFVGATAQVMIPFQAGLVALIFFRSEFLSEAAIPWIIFPAAIIILMLPVLWLQIPKVAHLRFMSAMLQRYPRYLEVFDHYSRKQMITIYLLSGIRYLVFCTQQFVLLSISGFTGTWLLSIGLSALSFLLITLVPSIAIGELGMRGGVNLFVFTPYFDNVPAILFSTFLLWIINLAIPALLGAVGLLCIRIKKPAA